MYRLDEVGLLHGCSDRNIWTKNIVLKYIPWVFAEGVRDNELKDVFHSIDGIWRVSF